jgi:hypothetical protein
MSEAAPFTGTVRFPAGGSSPTVRRRAPAGHPAVPAVQPASASFRPCSDQGACGCIWYFGWLPAYFDIYYIPWMY